MTGALQALGAAGDLQLFSWPLPMWQWRVAAIPLLLGLAAAFQRRFPGGLHSRSLGAGLVTGGGSDIWSVLDFGANPNATSDSTASIAAALAAASEYIVPGTAYLNGSGSATERGGLTLSLMGGTFLVSAPLLMPTGGFRLCCGALRASPGFVGDFMLQAFGGELLTIEDVTLDANHTTGGIEVNNVLRASIERVYVGHFATVGVQLVQGHEVHIGSSFFGEYWWIERHEHEMTGTAIVVDGQDHWISDVTIFAGKEGIRMRGGAAIIEGVHVYNGGSGPAIYLQAPYGSRSQRILGCYLDGRGIVVEAPAMGVSVRDSLFLQGTGVTINVTQEGASVSGLDVSGNQFAGAGREGTVNATVWVNTTLGRLGRESAGVRVENNAVDNAVRNCATRTTAHVLVSLVPGANGQTAVLRLNSSLPLPISDFPAAVTAASAIFFTSPPPGPLLAVQAVPLRATSSNATLLLQPVPATAEFPANTTLLVSVTVEQLTPAPARENAP